MMKSNQFVHRRKRPHAHTCVLRKYRRLRRKRSLRHEYKKLRSLLPAKPQTPPLKHKAAVVDAAYQYILQLQTALLDKFSRGVPTDLTGIVGERVTSAADLQTLALYLIQNGQVGKKVTS